MMQTLVRHPEDGELHESGPIDWEDGYVPVVCENVGSVTTDELEATRKTVTCPDCQEIGPKFEWSEDWNGRYVGTDISQSEEGDHD
jgi:hypothetical protein